MNRLIFRTVLCILLGVVTSVGVALGCEWRFNQWMKPNPSAMATLHIAPFAYKGGHVESVHGGYWYIEHVMSFGFNHLVYSPCPESYLDVLEVPLWSEPSSMAPADWTHDESVLSQGQRMSGWPLRCLTSFLTYPSDGNGEVVLLGGVKRGEWEALGFDDR